MSNAIVAYMNSRFFSSSRWTYSQVKEVVLRQKNKSGEYVLGPGIDCSEFAYETMLASGYNVSKIATDQMIKEQKGSASHLIFQNHATSPTH